MNITKQLTTAGAVLTLAAATLPGCEQKRDARDHDGYREIDSNTFLIRHTVADEDNCFAANLGRFRREVAGDFIIVPSFPESPMTHDGYAFRRTLESKLGTNTIVFQSVNPPAHD